MSAETIVEALKQHGASKVFERLHKHHENAATIFKEFQRQAEEELDQAPDEESPATLSSLSSKIDTLIQTLATKADIANMATKDDIANMATKDDIKKIAQRLECMEHNMRARTHNGLYGQTKINWLMNKEGVELPDKKNRTSRPESGMSLKSASPDMLRWILQHYDIPPTDIEDKDIRQLFSFLNILQTPY